MKQLIPIEAIEKAASNIRDVAFETPLMINHNQSKKWGAKL